MEKHYQKMIEDTQNRVIRSMYLQQMDKNKEGYGGFVEPTGIIQAKFSIYRVASMIAVYSNPDCSYYHNTKVYERILLGLNYIKQVQHPNGLFDYITCNFNSAPDTAFCVKKLIPVLLYLRKVTRNEEEEEIYQKVSELVHAAAHGLLEGGFHTPNHRWAIASVLMVCGKIYQETELMEAANVYLNEGIDCNEDGEFSEKSAGNYNRINNDAMILLSAATGDESYEKYAVRNLKMMLTYIEPDGSIFTANSTRFDKDHLIYPKDYYMEYLAMGIKYGIQEFVQMAVYIFELIEKKNLTSPDFLIWFMLYPHYREIEYGGEKLPLDTKFQKLYQNSGIVRGKSELFTYTVMNGKTNFFYFHNGTIKLEMKLSGSFCEHRGFRSEELEKLEDGTLHLHQTMHGWYYLPMEEKPETSDWWRMDNANRKKKLGPDMDLNVWVKEITDGVEIRMKTSGVDGAPFRVELAFMGVKVVKNEFFDLPVSGGEVVVAKSGDICVSNDTDELIVGPSFGVHHFTDGKEDSEAKVPGALTVCFTDNTSFDHTIRIINAKSSAMQEIE